MERVDLEQWERNRRTKVLHKIKAQQALRTGGRVITRSGVGYVLGRYNLASGTYQYWDSPKWVDVLNANISVEESVIGLERMKFPKGKGFIYSISKVFYRLVSVINVHGSATMYTDNIRLTNPNHYEMLSAVVNNV